MDLEDFLNALAECRTRIDDVDIRILALLNERTRIVEEIARIKQQARLPIYEPKREDEVFENIATHNGGPLGPDSVKRIFERIIDEMRVVQRIRMAEKSGSQGAQKNGTQE
jgi:chorismate mutase